MLGVCIEVIMYLMVDIFSFIVCMRVSVYICTGIRCGSLWAKTEKENYKMKKKSQYSNKTHTEFEKRVEKPHNKFLFFELFCACFLF